MSLQQYATLDPTLTIVESVLPMDSDFVASLVASGNPKANFLRPVNMVAATGFNPATQYPIQNGWTISPIDVQPVWVIQSFTAAQIQANAAQALWSAELSANLVTAFNTYIALAVPSQAQTTAVVVQLVKCVQALLEAKYGVTT